MYMMRISPLTAVVPFAVLLAVSFFVLFALRKVEEKALRAFGYVVAALLCFAALVVFLGTPYTGRTSGKMKYMMRRNMQGMPAMSMSGKEMPSKGQKIPASKCTGNKGNILTTK